MRFGLFHLLRFPEPWSAEKEQKCLWESIEQFTYAEEMGFSTLWLTEHHFIPAWSMASAPDVLLSAISQRTSRMRLGIAVVMSPIHHPLNTAVRMATLDLLSHGRVDLGLGRSTTPLQLDPFGVKMQDTRGMMEEALAIIPRVWTEEVFSHDGEYYHIPPREIAPKPLQKPHPPLWAACTQEETVQIAGELGIGCLIHGKAGPERVGKYIGTYKEAIKQARPVGKFINDHVVADIAAYCDENDQRAREKGAEWAASDALADAARHGKYWEGVSEQDVPPDYVHHFRAGQRRASMTRSDVTPEKLRDTGSGYCIGDPDACIRVAERYEALGVEELMLAIQVSPSTPHQDVMNTLRLFGKYIIPHFQEKEKRSGVIQGTAGAGLSARDPVII
jgi:alkanesulfonate monooxygenase SsuD/methylene tetrahydromethanopterin reductase-like flavin-dependent oxidoreductase (luciferase family)